MILGGFEQVSRMDDQPLPKKKKTRQFAGLEDRPLAVLAANNNPNLERPPFPVGAFGEAFSRT